MSCAWATRARSSAGRAPGLHPGGRRFEPGRVHQPILARVNHQVRFRERVSRGRNGGLGGHRERSEQAVPPDNTGAYSSVWLERTPDKREVGGSNPPRPTSSELS